jgi:hypothetical protein
MEPKYIVAIAVGGVFLLLFITFIVLSAIRAHAKKMRDEEIRANYIENKNIRLDYDFDVYGISGVPSPAQINDDTQVTIYDVLENNKTSQEEIFPRKEVEGFEEITGNYKPDKK